MLHIYTPFKCTDRQIHGPARWFLWCLSIPLRDDVIRQRAREGRHDQRKEGGMKTQERISKTNNGTKMATASAMGRPLASRPPDHQEEPWMRSECIHLPHSNRMTTSMTHWNHQANLSHHHHHHYYYRRASTVSSPSTLAFPFRCR